MPERGCGGALSAAEHCAERTPPISPRQDTIFSSPRGHLVLEGYYKKHDRVPIPMGTSKDTPKGTPREADALAVASSSEVPQPRSLTSSPSPRPEPRPHPNPNQAAETLLLLMGGAPARAARPAPPPPPPRPPA